MPRSFSFGNYILFIRKISVFFHHILPDYIKIEVSIAYIKTEKQRGEQFEQIRELQISAKSP